MDEKKIEMITDADIQPLELKHKKVYDFLKYILGNPLLDTYLSNRKQLDKWNKEVFDKPEKLSDDKDEKRFDRVMAFLKTSRDINDNLEYMKGKLLPSEVEKTKENYASIADEVRERSKGKG